MGIVNPLRWWVFSAGAPIYTARSRAEAHRLGRAWRAGVVLRVEVSRERHRDRASALAARAAGRVTVLP